MTLIILLKKIDSAIKLYVFIRVMYIYVVLRNLSQYFRNSTRQI
jgi:hypothetical protein